MGDASCSESVRVKWFCCAFNLRFLQLIFKASLIFKSILELASSVILKEREFYESKHVVVACRYLKIWDLLSFLYATQYRSRSSRSRMFFKIGVLKNFAIFTGKYLCWSLFLIKLQTLEPATLLIRDPNTAVFLWNLRKF